MGTVKSLLRWIVSLLILNGILGDDEPFQCEGIQEFNATQGKVGDLYSPLYLEKGEYPPDLKCEYRIYVPKGHYIKITFKDFDLEPSGFCNHDSLNLFGNNQQFWIKKLCGKDMPEVIVSYYELEFVQVIFITDFVVHGRGFHMQFETSPDFNQLVMCDEARCGNGKCYLRKQHCDGIDDCGDASDEEGCDYPLPTVECGETPIKPDTVLDQQDSPDRIVGGKEAIPGSWPWQVSMQYRWSDYSHSCGGSLINAQWVLTAAHCFGGNTVARNWRIHMGMHNKFIKDPYEQIRNVERIVIWPDKTEGNMDGYTDFNHDMALVKLNAPVNFTKAVRPVCLPKFGVDVPAGTRCYTTGWGETRGTGSNEVLKQLDVFVLPESNCTQMSNKATQICVTNRPGFQATCHGDSGGPLVTKFGQKWYVVGATSYSTETNYMHGLCAMPNEKTVFAKTSEFVEWIKKIIEQYS